MAIEPPGEVKFLERPALTTQHEVGRLVGSAGLLKGLREANHLVRNLLLGGAAGLLPLEGDEVGFAFFFKDEVDHVLAAIGPRPDLNLFFDAVAKVFEL